MIRILIIQDIKTQASSLHEALERFSDIEITIVDNENEALQLFKKQYFELLFLDISFNVADIVTSFKNYNLETVIIAFNVECEEEKSIEDIFAFGIKDCIGKLQKTDLISLHIQSYFDLISLKKQRLFHVEAINLFDKEIYQRMIIFKLNSHNARVEFWDYFMDDYFTKYEYMQESIGALYALSSWIYLNHHECEIVKETSENRLYLTLQPIDSLHHRVIENTLKKHDENVTYLIQNNKLSLKLTCNDVKSETKKIQETLEVDDETKSILGKTHFDKLSATEFIATTPISYEEKIDLLLQVEDHIDSALITFEENPTTQTTHLVANEFLEYIEVIKLFLEFDHIVFAIATLAKAIQEVTQEQLTPKEVKKFTTLTLHLVHDISLWRENIFIKQEANDVHYLDSSLLSSCLQIEAIFADKKIEEEEDDFELF
ncbi:MAG: response regulator [Campylobacterota bacterium]|nr:response regulator [Campylobacterota bacterium]